MSTILRRAPKTARRTPRRASSVLLVEQVLLGFLIAVAVMLFVMQGYRVSGSCMEPHLFTGERVLANKLAFAFHAPRRGDIVIFQYPRDPKQIYVKRIVGLPGETVSIQAGRVFVDGQPLAEPYKTFVAHGDMPPRFVPHDQFFVLGDNRDFSDDSRFWGDLPRGSIVGRAALCYWPSRQIGILR